MYKSVFTAQRNGKNLDILYSTVPSAMLDTAVRLDQWLLPWILVQISKLDLGRGALVQNWLNWTEQSQSRNQSIQSGHSGCNVPYSSLALSSHMKPHTSSIPSHTITLAAILTENRTTKHWVFVFCTESSRSDLVATLFNSPVFAKLFRQAISDIARPENVLPGTLSFKPFVIDIFSVFTVLSDHNTSNKRQDL